MSEPNMPVVAPKSVPMASGMTTTSSWGKGAVATSKLPERQILLCFGSAERVSRQCSESLDHSPATNAEDLSAPSPGLQAPNYLTDAEENPAP